MSDHNNHKVTQMLGHRMSAVEKTLDLYDQIPDNSFLADVAMADLERTIRMQEVLQSHQTAWQIEAFFDQVKAITDRMCRTTTKEN